MEHNLDSMNTGKEAIPGMDYRTKLHAVNYKLNEQD